MWYFKLNLIDEIEIHVFAQDDREILVIQHHHIWEKPLINVASLEVDTGYSLYFHLDLLGMDTMAPDNLVNFLLLSRR